MVAAYNAEPQGGLLGGISPDEAMRDAVDRGWQSVTMDEDAFDFAFSRREDRQIAQGRFSLGNEFWVSDATCGLGKGDLVDLRIPLRSGAKGIFVLHKGKPLEGRALPETLYHPLNRDGAREKSRRVKLQAAAIRDLKKQVDPSIDPATEILRGVSRAPMADAHGAIIRLGDDKSRQADLDQIEKRQADMMDFAAYYAAIERRTEGT